jgi:hypothetical protein
MLELYLHSPFVIMAGGNGLLPAFTLVSCSVYSSTLKMEAIYSSETSVDSTDYMALPP